MDPNATRAISFPIGKILATTLKESNYPSFWAVPQKPLKLIGRGPVLPHARCTDFFGNRFGPRDDSERPGLQKFCKILAIPWAPNHSICLAIRSEASGQRPNGQNDGAIRNVEGIWCPWGWQEFCRISAGLAIRIHPWAKTVLQKNSSNEV